MSPEPIVQQPQDYTGRIFTAKTLEVWRSSDSPVFHKLAADLSAAMPPLGSEINAGLQFALVKHAAVSAYLEAATQIQMFKGAQGQELRRRLTCRVGRPLVQEDIEMHRGALAECVVAWWLTRGLALTVTPYPHGAGQKILDFQIHPEPDRLESIGVEVKAPFRPPRHRPGDAWCADPQDTDHMGAVVPVMADANAKFEPSSLNLTVIVPFLDWHIAAAVIRAFEEQDFRNTSACMILSTIIDFESSADTDPPWCSRYFRHGCQVVANRHALRRIPEGAWGGWPQVEGPDYLPWQKPRRLSGSKEFLVDGIRTPPVTLHGYTIQVAPG